jgi:hypothetical protein
MFSNYTAFVIGAGASHELGLPLGSQLLTDILRLLDISFPNGIDQERATFRSRELLGNTPTAPASLSNCYWKNAI